MSKFRRYRRELQLWRVLRGDPWNCLLNLSAFEASKAVEKSGKSRFAICVSVTKVTAEKKQFFVIIFWSWLFTLRQFKRWREVVRASSYKLHDADPGAAVDRLSHLSGLWERVWTQDPFASQSRLRPHGLQNLFGQPAAERLSLRSGISRFFALNWTNFINVLKFESAHVMVLTLGVRKRSRTKQM